jgi:hypothetical protein
MTKKDYELIARVLRETSVLCLGGSYKDARAIQAYAEAFADEFALTNPRFNRERFLAACGVER